MRIKYRKTRQEGVLESVNRYSHPTNGARYKIMLNLKEHQWLVVDDSSELVAASGLRMHPHKMRIDARAALGQLGIILALDQRKRRRKQT